MSKLDMAPLDNHRSIDTILGMIPMDPEIIDHNGLGGYSRIEQNHDRTIEVRMNVQDTFSTDKPRIEISIFPDTDIAPAIHSLSLLELNRHNKDTATTDLNIHLNSGVNSELDSGIALLDKSLSENGVEFHPATTIRLRRTSREDSIQLWHGPETKADPKSKSTSICRRFEGGQPVYFIQRSGEEEQRLPTSAERYQHNPFTQIALAAEQLLDKIQDDIREKTPDRQGLEDFRRRRYPLNSPKLESSLHALEATKASRPIADFIKFPFRHQ